MRPYTCQDHHGEGPAALESIVKAMPEDLSELDPDDVEMVPSRPDRTGRCPVLGGNWQARPAEGPKAAGEPGMRLRTTGYLTE